MTIIGDFFKKLYYGNYLMYSKIDPQYSHEYDTLRAFSGFLALYSCGLTSLIFAIFNIFIIGAILGAITFALMLPFLERKMRDTGITKKIIKTKPLFFNNRIITILITFLFDIFSIIFCPLALYIAATKI